MFPQHDVLSERERAIIEMVSKGLSDGEISDLLHIKAGTGKNNIHRLFTKWQIHNRTQLAIVAYQLGLVDLLTINIWSQED